MGGLFGRYAALIIGVTIGLALGLTYTWVVDPVELVNTYPALLRTDYRQDWVRLAALSYVADGNLSRARARLDGLEQADVAGVIQALIEEYAAAGHPAGNLRSLTVLAQALDVHTPAMLVYLDTPDPPPPSPGYTPSPTPSPTHTPPPTHTPTPEPTYTSTPTPRVAPPSPTPLSVTPEQTSTAPPPTPTPPLLSRLQLADREQICEPGQTQRIEVVVEDERGRGVPGVEIWLMWPGGADRAVTGLKPQKGSGYADFSVEWGVNYSLGIGELGRPLITGLRLEPCSVGEDQKSAIGSWHIVLAPRPAETE